MVAEPGIALVGLPGTGKSTVGRLIARRLQRRYIDTDRLIEERTGTSVPNLLRSLGEPRFRELEREAVVRALKTPAAVVATGGGAVLDPLNRWDLARHGLRVWLDASADELVARLARSRVERPLVGPDAIEDLRRLAMERAPLYRSSDLYLDGSLPVEAAVDEVLHALRDDEKQRCGFLFDGILPRPLPQGPLHERIVLGWQLTPSTLRHILDELHVGHPSLVADERVAAAHPALVEAVGAARTLMIPAGEQAKRMGALNEILEWLAEERAERGDGVIALGGGTTGDVVGLAAAMYARGVPLVHLPTSWLAQLDSALGGKVAIDLERAKNAVGAIWPPWGVIADVALLGTLPADQLRNGLAEAIKSAIIGDPVLWQLLHARGRAALDGTDDAARYAITERAARVKLDIVGLDPFEVGERRQLNLGHTIGHGVEAASGFRLAHGAAVALGLRAVTRIAGHRSGNHELGQALDDLLEMLGFALRAPFDTDAVIDAMSRDKKRAAGRQRWILPVGIGQVEEVDDVTDTELADALAHIQEVA